MKKIFVVLFAAVMLFGVVTVSALAENGITVLIDGRKIEFDEAPFIENDRVMVPARAVFEAFGAKVEWKPEESSRINEGVNGVEWSEDVATVNVEKGVNELVLYIGKAAIYKNGGLYSIDAPAVIKNDRTFVPLRTVGEALDCNVEWDNDTRTVKIDSIVPPVELSYVTESVTRETEFDGVTVTVNFTYPQITDGKDFVDERATERINEIAKDFTYDVFDYKRYVYEDLGAVSSIMNHFEGYPNITIDVKCVMYTSEKYGTVSFGAYYTDPYFGKFTETETVSRDGVFEYNLWMMTGAESEDEFYSDIYNVFAENFEYVRYGKEIIADYPDSLGYIISGDKFILSFGRALIAGMGGKNCEYCIIKQY